MYTRRNIRWNIILNLSWRRLSLFAVWAFLVVLFYRFLSGYGIDASIPIAPLGTIGVAVAFYVGFKNNQAYDRFWEARKIWGGIVNVSRAWGNQVMTYVSANSANSANSAEVDDQTVIEARRALIYGHLAWITALRWQLRGKTPWGYVPKGYSAKFVQPTDLESLKQQLHEFLSAREIPTLCSTRNMATQILREQGEHLRRIVEDEPRLIEEFRLISMMDLITEMYTLQGKCERIKNTPFPRQYAFFSMVFVWIFNILLPFGILGELASRGEMIWLTVPLAAIISWIFLTMEGVGDSSEDPFENFVNDVPMTALCRTIEIDLREMLGETELPDSLQPVNDILM